MPKKGGGISMHEIEPFYNWRHIYVSEEDERSPFYGRVYSEFEFSQTIYNYYIHPQWDEFGSRTLYMKVIMADYEEGYAVIELLGEWNDAIENDIMNLKREVVDKFQQQGIYKFIIITENVLNFHSGDRDYYEEWYEEMTDENGWVTLLNMPEQTQYDFKRAKLNRYLELMDLGNWRTYKPYHLFKKIDDELMKRLS
ncbi:hypothetical protein KJS94_02305 [Flavihumibacter rivuli]|uniref:hypothetical protein n=1 Tax=Flavihumibacter rivuli TaxID=2838156 RepID=UPI001EFA4831|nr:hypothetical protein [Flavihumibacter rivuli]ULQ57028.1 hypothetical protein KJS94_02305 [Flavihumibacter rivuli]